MIRESATGGIRVERIIENTDQNVVARPSSSLPPEPDCAWYCPIHFCGYGWGIYIRESCIFSLAIHIAAFVNWSLVHIPQTEIARHLLLGADRYRPYKRKAIAALSIRAIELRKVSRMRRVIAASLKIVMSARNPTIRRGIATISEAHDSHAAA
jgi:hypothetical protein